MRLSFKFITLLWSNLHEERFQYVLPASTALYYYIPTGIEELTLEVSTLQLLPQLLHDSPAGIRLRL